MRVLGYANRIQLFNSFIIYFVWFSLELKAEWGTKTLTCFRAVIFAQPNWSQRKLHNCHKPYGQNLQKISLINLFFRKNMDEEQKLKRLHYFSSQINFVMTPILWLIFLLMHNMTPYEWFCNLTTLVSNNKMWLFRMLNKFENKPLILRKRRF
jgi:hypothetical protein